MLRSMGDYPGFGACASFPEPGQQRRGDGSSLRLAMGQACAWQWVKPTPGDGSNLHVVMPAQLHLSPLGLRGWKSLGRGAKGRLEEGGGCQQLSWGLLSPTSLPPASEQPRGRAVPGAGTRPSPRRSRLSRRPASHYLGMWLWPAYGRQILPGGVKGGDGAAAGALALVPRSGRVPRGCSQVGAVSGVRKGSVSKSPLPGAGCTPGSRLDRWGNLQGCLLGSLQEADRWTGKKYR